MGEYAKKVSEFKSQHPTVILYRVIPYIDLYRYTNMTDDTIRSHTDINSIMSPSPKQWIVSGNTCQRGYYMSFGMNYENVFRNHIKRHHAVVKLELDKDDYTIIDPLQHKSNIGLFMNPDDETIYLIPAHDVWWQTRIKGGKVNTGRGQADSSFTAGRKDEEVLLVFNRLPLKSVKILTNSDQIYDLYLKKKLDLKKEVGKIDHIWRKLTHEFIKLIKDNIPRERGDTFLYDMETKELSMGPTGPTGPVPMDQGDQLHMTSGICIMSHNIHGKSIVTALESTNILFENQQVPSKKTKRKSEEPDTCGVFNGLFNVNDAVDIICLQEDVYNDINVINFGGQKFGKYCCPNGEIINGKLYCNTVLIKYSSNWKIDKNLTVCQMNTYKTYTIRSYGVIHLRNMEDNESLSIVNTHLTGGKYDDKNYDITTKVLGEQSYFGMRSDMIRDIISDDTLGKCIITGDTNIPLNSPEKLKEHKIYGQHPDYYFDGYMTLKHNGFNEIEKQESGDIYTHCEYECHPDRIFTNFTSNCTDIIVLDTCDISIGAKKTSDHKVIIVAFNVLK